MQARPEPRPPDRRFRIGRQGLKMMTDDKAAQIESLLREAAECRACPLWKDATQTVFGEGPAEADIIFVGEQPGDREDRAGRPFVGPAGLMLDRALAEAGVTASAPM